MYTTTTREFKMLNSVSSEEARKLEEMGISQWLSEKLVLSDAFEDESSYALLESLILKLKQIAETGEERTISKIEVLLSSKAPAKNKSGLFEIGLIECSDALLDSTWLLAKALRELV